jgi:competence protein ComEA
MEVPTPNAPRLLNINTATQAELETLPRIGPSTAQAIIEYRDANGPFVTIDDLVEVPGIGPATLENLRELISVE